MSLLFFKNNKPDNRMIEYDQSVVRLGLEKAELEREVEIMKREARQISIAISLAQAAYDKDKSELAGRKMKEAKELSNVLVNYEKQVTDEKKKLEDLVLNQKQVADSIIDCEKKLVLIENTIKETDDIKVALVKTADALVEDRKQKDRERNSAAALLQETLKEKNKAVSELYELNVRKSESERILEKANRDLVELNEIVSILQATNRHGLDLVASFEGERKRLREREEFLIRKEQDLLLYEKRVEKMREDAGNKIKMSFK